MPMLAWLKKASEIESPSSISRSRCSSDHERRANSARQRTKGTRNSAHNGSQM
jgi:hypothetical protein